MHPPFGFALFYLRSVAPMKEYVDKLTGKRMPPVTTMQIYWGAVPFVLIQVVMVALVILFPQMVMVYKSGESTLDPTKIEIVIPQSEAPAAGADGQPATEQQNQDKEDSAAQSLQDAFKAPAAPDAKK